MGIGGPSEAQEIKGTKEGTKRKRRKGYEPVLKIKVSNYNLISGKQN
jgi:hypothetical protein